MSRLTDKVRNFDGTASSKESLIDEKYNCPNDYCSKVLTKLADYEDKQEQGLLIELKVPLGTPIWYLEEDFHDDTIEISCGFYDLQWIHFHKDEDFYLTKDKAEEALARIKGE